MDLLDIIGRALSQTDPAKYDPAKAGPPPTLQELLAAGSLATTPAPFLPDILGVGADIEMYRTQPEERTWPNYGMTAASLLSGIPAVSATKLAKKTLNPPKMSRAEAVEKGYWHPIGVDKKLPMPIDQMSFKADPIEGLSPRETISPETLFGGRLVPATGDRSAAGKMLREINGVQLPSPVELEGGADFMRTHRPHGSAWASDKGVISQLSKKVREAASDGRDVYMPHVTMGHGSMDFNTMMSDALLEQILGKKIPKRVVRVFDSEVRALRPECAGLLSDRARDQLNSTGALRHAFMSRAELKKFQDAGFPDLASTRFALTEPELLDAPLHASGFSIAKMDPSGRVISDPIKPHSTYNTQLAGEYVGGLDTLIPREVMFSDFYKRRRAAGLPERADYYSFMRSNPVQDANQEWLDGIMRYIEMSKAD